MPQWAGSCWYYLRYLDPKNTKAPVDPKKEKYWMNPHGVDLYVGGAEHAVLHLLYSRFWHKFLYDIKVVSTPEPFHKLLNVGLILAPDGTKMSKSVGKAINPDDLIEEFGSDAFRLTEMFLGPFIQTAIWNTKGIVGMKRFLNRILKVKPILGDNIDNNVNSTIKKINSDIESFEFNTAISALMECLNKKERSFTKNEFEIFIKLLSPFAPKTAQEVWEKIGNDGLVSEVNFPEFDSNIKVSESEVVVQINSKVRSKFTTLKNVEKEIIEQAKSNARIKELLKNQKILKEIVALNKNQNSYIINFVVK
jgi:leucyl-tRNA synthetase